MTTIPATPAARLTVPAPTAIRFLGHFLAALVGVTILGTRVEH
ncbi:hypothetical protein [Actinosynnema sp. NPDC020468]